MAEHTTILKIPVNQEGDSLFIKDWREDNGRYFLKFKSTLNKIPFRETEVGVVGEMVTIAGDDGQVIFNFHISWLGRL